MKGRIAWPDVLIRVLAAALAALLGAVTEQQAPGSLTGLVPYLGAALAADPADRGPSELKWSPRLQIQSLDRTLSA